MAVQPTNFLGLLRSRFLADDPLEVLYIENGLTLAGTELISCSIPRSKCLISAFPLGVSLLVFRLLSIRGILRQAWFAAGHRLGAKCCLS